MTIENTYTTIAGWLNSAITDEQLELCQSVAYQFLLVRHGARLEYDKIMEAAEIKRTVPNHKILYAC